MRLPQAALAMLAVSLVGCPPTKVDLNPVLTGVLKDSYTTMSANQFESLVSSVSWGNGETQDRCTSAMCTTKVSVHIDANLTSYTVDSVNSSVQGRLVARVQNNGGDTTYMYHFKPAPYVYYFLVKRSGAGSKWVLLEHHAGFAPDSVAGGHFDGCWDHLPAIVAHADFRKCGPRIYPAFKDARILAVASPTAEPSAPGSRLTQFTEAPAWIGCKYGCCPMSY